VFGSLLNLPKLVEGLSESVKVEPASLNEEICVRLLNDSGRTSGYIQLEIPRTNWKRPFVATEIGEALPHWRPPVYLVNPAKLTHSAQTFETHTRFVDRRSGTGHRCGGWLIVTDLKRQLTLARQKTDFVSNVSTNSKRRSRPSACSRNCSPTVA